MVQELRQSTAVVVHIGSFVDVGDGFTPEVGVTLSGADEAEVLKHAATTTTSISGLTFAAITGCDGHYALSLGTGETDTLGDLDVIVQDDSLCLPVKVSFSVITANAWDSKYASDVREVDVISWLGTAAATPTVAGVPEVDVTHLGGGTQSLLDLKDFADDGYDPSTDKVTGVLLVDTTTTNTDMLTAAAVNAEVDTALVDIGLDHMVSASVAGADIADDSIIAQMVSKSETADWDSFVHATDSLEAIKDEIGSAVSADISADIAAVKAETVLILADTTDIQPKIGTPAADLAADIAAIPTVAEINTEVDTALTDIGLDHLVSAAVVGADVTDNSIMARIAAKGATADWDTFVNTTDSLEAIRDEGSANWVTGAGGSDPFVLQTTTIATLASQVSFTLTAGSADDGAYVGMLAIVEDASTSTQKAIGVVSAYTGATKTITLREDPGVFTMAVGDTIDIGAISPDILNILADTGDIQPKIGSPATDVSADIAAVKAETALILTDTGTTLDTKLNDIQGATFSSATDSLEAIRDRGDGFWITGGGTGLSSLSSGTAQAGAATTITLASGDSATNSIYNGERILLTGGTGAGQSRVITGYVGSTKVATVARAWTTNPDGTSTYEIQSAGANLETIIVDEQSAIDLKDFADAGYDPGSNKVNGVVLVDTCTTNTDVRGTDSAALASVCTEARLAELDGANLPSDIDAILVDTGTTLSADIAALPTGNENADALLDRANAIETGLTLRQAQRLIAASTAGKLSGLPDGTPAVFRNAVADSKARITATTDADGNRTAITWDVT